MNTESATYSKPLHRYYIARTNQFDKQYLQGTTAMKVGPVLSGSPLACFAMEKQVEISYNKPRYKYNG